MKSYAREDEWVESPRGMVFSPECSRTVKLLAQIEYASFVSMNWYPSVNASAGLHLEIHIQIAVPSEQGLPTFFLLPSLLSSVVCLVVRDRTLYAKLAACLLFVNLMHGRVPRIMRWTCAISLEVICARFLEPWRGWTAPSGPPAFRRNVPIVIRLRVWSGRGRTGTGSTFTAIVAKTASFSPCTLPVCFPLTAIFPVSSRR